MNIFQDNQNCFQPYFMKNRPSIPDDIAGAYWTGVGICAHQSALAGGKAICVPDFG